MIVSLSNSLKAIALSDATKKSVQSWKIQLRFKSGEEKLGLPAKPTRPIGPYYRFANESRPSLVTKHPNLKPYEIDSILGKMWQSLDPADREPFIKQYKTDLNKYYSNEYTKYRSSLSDADRRRIREMEMEIKNRKELAAQQRKLVKPKKPMSSFFRYYKEQSDRKANEPHKNYVQRVKTRWNELSETEKEKFNTSAEEEAAYRKARLQWEHAMLKLEQGARSNTKKLSKNHKPIPADE